MWRECFVCFQNRFYLLPEDCFHKERSQTVVSHDAVLSFVSHQTGWPTSRLNIVAPASGSLSFTDKKNASPCRPHALAVNDTTPFWTIRVTVTSQLLGGKGGFGSLLKSQSRQAGAKATTNFGACRDLQGRRLRHVNEGVLQDTIRSWDEKIAAGQATVQEKVKALTLQTPSGIPGWYLQLPAWADVSKKEYRKYHRQFRNWKKDEAIVNERRAHESFLKESQVQQYVQKAEEASESVRNSVQSALQQGLKQQQQNKKRAQKRSKTQPEPPTALVTLSGDVVLAFESETDRWQVQSQSNFGTMGIVLQSEKVLQLLEGSAKNNDRSGTGSYVGRNDSSHASTTLYWEILLVTGGLVQVGWAQPTADFAPESETGDGVGDDAASYAYDGSRQIKLHRSDASSFGDRLWKAGDVVGCLWNVRTGQLSYSLNGQSLGVAFVVKGGAEIEKPSETPAADTVGDEATASIPSIPEVFFPAASLNPREIVELHLTAADVKHMPQDAMPVGDWMAVEHVGFASSQSSSEQPKEHTSGANAPHPTETEDSKPRGDGLPEPQQQQQNEPTDDNSTKPPTSTTPVEPQALPLDEYEVVEDLETLGLDRLKSALMALGVKCGGTLRQRAERLFSLKGLGPDEFPKKLLAKKTTKA